MNTTQTTATQTFDRMTGDNRWLGFGYLGERDHMLNSTDPDSPAQPELVATTDQRILEVTADWTADELFHWANSKDGRWFADMVFGCDDTFEHAARYIRKQPVR
jgi:hypothetical protein